MLVSNACTDVCESVRLYVCVNLYVCESVCICVSMYAGESVSTYMCESASVSKYVSEYVRL